MLDLDLRLRSSLSNAWLTWFLWKKVFHQRQYFKGQDVLHDRTSFSKLNISIEFFDRILTVNIVLLLLREFNLLLVENLIRLVGEHVLMQKALAMATFRSNLHVWTQWHHSLSQWFQIIYIHAGYACGEFFKICFHFSLCFLLLFSMHANEV